MDIYMKLLIKIRALMPSRVIYNAHDISRFLIDTFSKEEVEEFLAEDNIEVYQEIIKVVKSHVKPEIQEEVMRAVTPGLMRVAVTEAFAELLKVLYAAGYQGTNVNNNNEVHEIIDYYMSRVRENFPEASEVYYIFIDFSKPKFILYYPQHEAFYRWDLNFGRDHQKILDLYPPVRAREILREDHTINHYSLEQRNKIRDFRLRYSI